MTDLLPRTEPDASTSRRLAQLLRLQPMLALLPLRLFLGVTFTYAGLQKLADPSFLDPHNPRSLQGQLALVRDASPLRFMLGMVADHAVFFGVAIALTELAVGLAVLVGLWARAAAVVGALLALSFLLTISWQTAPYYYGPDIVFLFAWTPFVLAGAPVFSLDAWRLGQPQLGVLPATGGQAAAAGPARGQARGAGSRQGAGQQRRYGRPTQAELDRERRTFLATSAVGAAAVVAAGLDAGIGRALHGPAGSTRAAVSTPGATASGRSKPTHHPTHQASSPPAQQVQGTVLGDASQVPVGSAAQFQDPGSGNPAWVVQPSAGQFKAFSAICTHAGCTVSFDKGSGDFICPCHGGVYDGKTGGVLAGPPPAPLQAIDIKESGGKLIVPPGA